MGALCRSYAGEFDAAALALRNDFLLDDDDFAVVQVQSGCAERRVDQQREVVARLHHWNAGDGDDLERGRNHAAPAPQPKRARSRGNTCCEYRRRKRS
jgi:hypothetical protein